MNVCPQGQDPEAAVAAAPPKFSEAQRLQPLRTLLLSGNGGSGSRQRGAAAAAAAAIKPPPPTSEEVEQLSATQCRDRLLAMGPLDAAWVRRVNQVEAEYWRRW